MSTDCCSLHPHEAVRTGIRYEIQTQRLKEAVGTVSMEQFTSLQKSKYRYICWTNVDFTSPVLSWLWKKHYGKRKNRCFSHSRLLLWWHSQHNLLWCSAIYTSTPQYPSETTISHFFLQLFPHVLFLLIFHACLLLFPSNSWRNFFFLSLISSMVNRPWRFHFQDMELSIKSFNIEKLEMVNKYNSMGVCMYHPTINVTAFRITARFCMHHHT